MLINSIIVRQTFKRSDRHLYPAKRLVFSTLTATYFKKKPTTAPPYPYQKSENGRSKVSGQKQPEYKLRSDYIVICSNIFSSICYIYRFEIFSIYTVLSKHEILQEIEQVFPSFTAQNHQRGAANFSSLNQSQGFKDLIQGINQAGKYIHDA